MFGVLFVWACEHPSTSYRQGMHELLAPLLLALEEEARLPEKVRDVEKEPSSTPCIDVNQGGTGSNSQSAGSRAWAVMNGSAGNCMPGLGGSDVRVASNGNFGKSEGPATLSPDLAIITNGWSIEADCHRLFDSMMDQV